MSAVVSRGPQVGSVDAPKYMDVTLGLDLGDDYDLICKRRPRDPGHKRMSVREELHRLFTPHPAYEVDWLIAGMGCHWDEPMILSVDEKKRTYYYFFLSFAYMGERPSQDFMADAICSAMGSTRDDWTFLGYPCRVESVRYLDGGRSSGNWGEAHATYSRRTAEGPSNGPTAASPSPLPPTYPRTMKARIGGYFGSSYFVELRSDTVWYEVTDDHYENRRGELITPTEEQWTQFRADLDAAAVWRWRKRYFAPNVEEGNSWAFEIAYDDAAVRCEGRNWYPTETGAAASRPTPSFKAILDAVRALLAGREFR